MAKNANNINELKQLISERRLARLIERTGSASEAIALHQETLRLGGLLIIIIGTVEIALRNSVYMNLKGYFGVADWLQYPPISLRWHRSEQEKITKAIAQAQREKYAKLGQAEKSALDARAYPDGVPQNLSHFDKTRARQRCLPVDHTDIIPELSFNFWKTLYGPAYGKTLWQRTLKKTFPDKQVTRPEIAEQLERIYKARNRLAHHEPVMRERFSDTINAIVFIAQRLGSPNVDPDTPLANLLAADLQKAGKTEQDLRTRIDGY